jgi:hypothetical protein
VRKVIVEGQTIEFPDDVTEQEIDAIITGPGQGTGLFVAPGLQRPAGPQRPMPTFRQGLQGIGQGVRQALPGIGRDIRQGAQFAGESALQNLELLGAGAGGMLGLATPVPGDEFALSALGGAAGNAAENLIKEWRGIQEPRTPSEAMWSTVGGAVRGAVGEAGGQLVGRGVSKILSPWAKVMQKTGTEAEKYALARSMADAGMPVPVDLYAPSKTARALLWASDAIPPGKWIVQKHRKDFTQAMLNLRREFITEQMGLPDPGKIGFHKQEVVRLYEEATEIAGGAEVKIPVNRLWKWIQDNPDKEMSGWLVRRLTRRGDVPTPAKITKRMDYDDFVGKFDTPNDRVAIDNLSRTMNGAQRLGEYGSLPQEVHGLLGSWLKRIREGGNALSAAEMYELSTNIKAVLNPLKKTKAIKEEAKRLFDDLFEGMNTDLSAHAGRIDPTITMEEFKRLAPDIYKTKGKFEKAPLADQEIMREVRDVLMSDLELFEITEGKAAHQAYKKASDYRASLGPLGKQLDKAEKLEEGLAKHTKPGPRNSEYFNARGFNGWYRANLNKLKRLFTPEELENIDLFRRKALIAMEETEAYVKSATAKSKMSLGLGAATELGTAAAVYYQPGLAVPLGFQSWVANSIYKPSGYVRKWLTSGLEQAAGVPKIKFAKEAAKAGGIKIQEAFTRDRNQPNP